MARWDDTTQREDELITKAELILSKARTPKGGFKTMKLGTIAKRMGMPDTQATGDELTKAFGKARLIRIKKRSAAAFWWQNNYYRYVPDGRDARYDADGNKL